MLLITPAEVILSAFTSREQITSQSIRPIKIDVAQEHYIRPRFGDQFFEQMCKGEFADFVDRYIKPSLAQYVRYGVIDELSVQLGDNGAIVYGMTDQVTARNASSDESQNHTKTTTHQSEVTSTQIKTDSQNEKITSTDQTDQESYNDTTLANFLQENGSTTSNVRGENTKTLSSDLSVNEVGQTTNQDKLVATATSKDQINENRQIETMRTATIAERRVIAARALSDANILLAKAVRYVERNVDQFESYLPSSLSNRLFF